MKNDSFYRLAEPLDLIGVCLRPVSNQLLFVILKFGGRIDFERMQKTICELLFTYPLLACELDISPRWPLWKMRKDIDHLKLITVQNEEADESLMAEHVGLYRDPGSPTIHVTLFRGRTTDALCFDVDHTLADAAGAKDLVYAAAEIYSQLEQSSYMAPPLPALAGAAIDRSYGKLVPIKCSRYSRNGAHRAGNGNFRCRSGNQRQAVLIRFVACRPKP